MIFAISKKDNKYFAQTFDSSWEDAVKDVQGETVVEMFISDSLQRVDFEDYFRFNYLKKLSKNEN